MTKTSIFLVEDDENLGSLLRESLELKEYDVTLYRDGEEAWKNYDRGAYHICILDVMMPKKDGFTLAKEIRKVDEKVPIMFLTAKSMKEDKIEGFRLGADDYLTKPFSMEELQLRIEAILRRSQRSVVEEPTEPIINIGKYAFNWQQRMLTHSAGEERKLTTKENALLKLLSTHKNTALERDVALKTVWGNDNYFTGRSMDVYITKLRKYLKEDPNVEILNIHGVGFKLLEK